MAKPPVDSARVKDYSDRLAAAVNHLSARDARHLADLMGGLVRRVEARTRKETKS